MYLVLFLVDLSCFKNLLQTFEETFHFFMIPDLWSINFQLDFTFHMSLSSVCLLSIRQLRKLLAKM